VSQAPILQEAGWAPEPALIFWGRKDICVRGENLTPAVQSPKQSSQSDRAKRRGSKVKFTVSAASD
jgi:hypothetical protein